MEFERGIEGESRSGRVGKRGAGEGKKRTLTLLSQYSVNHTCFLRDSVVQVGRYMYELTFLRYSSRTAHFI